MSAKYLTMSENLSSDTFTLVFQDYQKTKLGYDNKRSYEQDGMTSAQKNKDRKTDILKPNRSIIT